MSKLSIVIAVQFRWLITGIWLWRLFSENQGIATRAFFILVFFYFEALNLIFNIKHWKKA